MLNQTGREFDYIKEARKAKS